ncbi:MAG: NAD-dependent epimerase/dehydratase family protein [Bryobacteraceae bacterium]
MAAELSGSKVLVTGGLGFIGHHLAEALIGAGAAVTIVDNRSTSVARPEQFQGRARLILANLRDADLSERFDWVCHLASPVGPTRVMWAAGEVATGIVQDAKWLIDTFGGTETRILFVSSSEVYGHGGVGAETDALTVRLPYSGRREYACAKTLAEVMLHNAQRTGRLSVLAIRPFNVVGPAQSGEGGFVIPRFIEAVISGRSLTVYGDGTQRRCFTHVLDVSEAMMALMAIGAIGLFNVANPANEISIGELARRFREAAMERFPGLRPDVVAVDPADLHGPLYEEAPDKLADISKLCAAVRWRPSRSIDSILAGAMDELAHSLQSHILIRRCGA